MPSCLFISLADTNMRLAPTVVAILVSIVCTVTAVISVTQAWTTTSGAPIFTLNVASLILNGSCLLYHSYDKSNGANGASTTTSRTSIH